VSSCGRRPPQSRRLSSAGSRKRSTRRVRSSPLHAKPMARLPRLHPRTARTGGLRPRPASQQARPGRRHLCRSRRNQWPLGPRAMARHRGALPPRSPLRQRPHRTLRRSPRQRHRHRHLRFRSRRPRSGRGRPHRSGAPPSPARGRDRAPRARGRDRALPAPGRDRAPPAPGPARVARPGQARVLATTPTARPRPGWAWRPARPRPGPVSPARLPGAPAARPVLVARGQVPAVPGRRLRMSRGQAARVPAVPGPAQATCRRARRAVAAVPVARGVAVPVARVAAHVPVAGAALVGAAPVPVARRGPVVSAVAGVPAVPAAVAAVARRARSGAPAGGRRAAASRVSSGARSSTTCRPRRSAACRSRAATGR
jgi:hypothetical protein